MKRYRKLAELLSEDISDRQPEFIKELLYSVWLMETYYPDDNNSVVLVLDSEQELKEVFKLFQFLNYIEPEIDDTTWCDNDSGFRKIIWVTGQDGSGIIALFEVRYKP